ncbi:MAG TPA: LacI family DNA-binding transcriptional regulator [Chitinophagaceae bacterium]|nr:LacI family DNA-binding transcriptional regulator [Chitinophagaceae bacterium]
MAITLKRLAKELNLSIATISRALRDSHEVSDETKRKVFALAEKLNYHPNPFASSLRAHKSKTIAVIIPEIDNNFFSLAIKGIEEIAQQQGYHVLIYLTHESVQKEISFTRHLQSGRVDGILMSVSSETNNVSHLLELKEKNIPIVFFDRVCEMLDSPKVTTDDYESAKNATEHLIENGCKRIAYLQLSKTLSIGKNRLKGYVDALQKNKITFDQELILDAKSSTDENYDLIKNLLTSKNPPDGIFASVESLAVIAYYVCKDLHISIPGNIKIISFSNLTTAPLLSPSLTTVTQPAFNMGKEAATILFQLLKKNSFILKKNIILSSSLIKRDSTKK